MSAARQLLVWLAAGLWAGLFAYAFIAFQATAPTGDGFTRGYNRVGVFLTWQGYALIAAIAAWILGRNARRASPATKAAARLPLVISGLFFLGVAGLIAYLAYTAGA